MAHEDEANNCGYDNAGQSLVRSIFAVSFRIDLQDADEECNHNGDFLPGDDLDWFHDVDR